MCEERNDVRMAPGARARGFTLIELMVVIVILGLLIGLVGPNVINAIVRAGKGTANAQMQHFAEAINMYLIQKRSLPTSLEELQQPDENGNPYIEKLPLDPWGQPYDYKIVDPRTKKFEISSAGEDKTPGTDDDLFWPERESK